MFHEALILYKKVVHGVPLFLIIGRNFKYKLFFKGFFMNIEKKSFMIFLGGKKRFFYLENILFLLLFVRVEDLVVDVAAARHLEAHRLSETPRDLHTLYYSDQR